MKLYSDLKYIGENNLLKVYGDIWHCTCCVTDYKTGEMKFIVQPPQYHDEIFMGYTNLSAILLTEEDLEKDFKIVNKDGTLSDIIHDEKERKQYEKEIDEYFDNMSDEEFNKLINGR